MISSVAVSVRRVCVRFGVAALLGVAAIGGAAGGADAQDDDGFVVTLAKAQNIGPLVGRPAYEPGTSRIYLTTARQIFRLADDRRHFEVVAGTAEGVAPVGAGHDLLAKAVSIRPVSIAFHPVTRQLYVADAASHRILRLTLDGQRFEIYAGSGLTNFDPQAVGLTALQENLSPSDLIFHPKTNQLHFVNARTQIMAISEYYASGARVEVIAGTGSRRGEGHDELGTWRETDMTPEDLKFHPITGELHFVSKYVFDPGNGDDDWDLYRLRGNGSVASVVQEEEYEAKPSYMFHPGNGDLYMRDTQGEINRIQTGGGNSLWTLFGTTSSLSEGDPAWSMVYDSATGGDYYTTNEVGRWLIRRLSPNGRRIDLITGDGVAKMDGPANAWSLTGRRSWSLPYITLKLLETDPVTHNLLFLENHLVGRESGSLSLKAFVLPDAFGSRVNELVTEAKKALDAGDLATFESKLSDLRLLSGPTEKLLRAVDRKSKGGGLPVAEEFHDNKALWHMLGGALPKDVVQLIASHVDCDPHHLFRVLRAQAGARELAQLELETFRARTTQGRGPDELPYFFDQIMQRLKRHSRYLSDRARLTAFLVDGEEFLHWTTMALATERELLAASGWPSEFRWYESSYKSGGFSVSTEVSAPKARQIASYIRKYDPRWSEFADRFDEMALALERAANPQAVGYEAEAANSPGGTKLKGPLPSSQLLPLEYVHARQRERTQALAGALAPATQDAATEVQPAEEQELESPPPSDTRPLKREREQDGDGVTVPVGQQVNAGQEVQVDGLNDTVERKFARVDEDEDEDLDLDMDLDMDLDLDNVGEL